MDEKKVQEMIDSALKTQKDGFEEKIKTIQTEGKTQTDQLKAELKEAKDSLKETATRLSEAQRTHLEVSVDAFLEQAKKDLKITPAEAVPAKHLLLKFAETPGTIKFSEGEGDKKRDVEKSYFQLMKDFIDARPKVVAPGTIKGLDGKPGNPHIDTDQYGDEHVDEQSVKLAERAEAILKRDKMTPEKYGEALRMAEAELQKEGVL